MLRGGLCRLLLEFPTWLRPEISVRVSAQGGCKKPLETESLARARGGSGTGFAQGKTAWMELKTFGSGMSWFMGFRIKVSGDEHAQKSRLRLTLQLPGGTLRLCYTPPA